jgi:ribosomal protein L7Ae-like RNA K-turn-binding protein
MKAGKLRTGEEQAEKLLRSGDAELVVVAEDASENTRQKFIKKCFFYQKPLRVFGERVWLSHCIGKQNRVVLVITDAGFATLLQDVMEDVTVEIARR